MLKIALLFLFCAISGYGINGLPDNTNVAIKPENNKPMPTVVEVKNLTDTISNDKASPPQSPSSSLPITIPEKTVTEQKNIILNAGSTEKNISTTAKAQIVENASTIVPWNKNLPVVAEKSSKTAPDDLNISVTTIGSLAITESPATTKYSSTAVPIILSQNDSLTTTALPVTTTEAPVVPPPTPKAGKWVVNKNNKTCIIVNMAVQFNVSYVDKENKTISKLFNLPDSDNATVVTGECGKLEQFIRLSFNDIKNVTNNFTLHFVQNETVNQYSLHHLEVILLNPNNTVVFEHNTPLFSIGLNNSYRCLKKQNFDLTQNGTNKTMGDILISELQFQAFKTDNNKDFGQVKDCKLDTPDIVPIAVGCALAGLVVIVLIAYLVGRRRNQGRNYTSM